MSMLHNALIESLPARQRRHLESLCAPVDLVAGDVLQQADARTLNVYFPLGARVCLLAEVHHEPVLQVSMVGSEGLVGAQVAHGNGRAPLTAIVQSAGTALRATAVDIRGEVRRSATLLAALDRQADVTLRQVSASAACLCVHDLAPRLVRWLLMTRECAGSQRFTATHEAIADLLGVRRAGVTTAAANLQRAGLITYVRGMVTLLDLPGLRAVSCTCHRLDSRLHALLLAPLLGRRGRA